MDEMMRAFRAELENVTDDYFLMYQERNGIESGDVSPLAFHRMMEALSAYVDAVRDAMEEQNVREEEF